MINEFNASRQRVFRVNPQLGGALDVSVDTSVKPNSAERTAEMNADGATARLCGRNAAVDAVGRYVKQLYAPVTYGLADTHAFFNFSSWYTVHTIYRGAAGALAMRTLLISAGVNHAVARLVSPLLSLLVHRLVRRATPLARMRKHRLLRDAPFKASVFYGGVAASLLSILEVLMASRRVGSSALTLPLALGAGAALASAAEMSRREVAQYVASECGLTFPSLPSYTLLRTLAREYRESCDLFAGMTGLLSCLAVSPDSVLTWTTLFSAATAFASLQAARCVIDRRLTVERLEKCLRIFSLSMQPSGELLPLNDAALSVGRVTKEESVLTPPLPWIHQRVPITFGDSFYTAMSAAHSLSTRQKMQVVQHVEECLATRGIALIFNQHTNTYHVLFAGRLTPGPILDRSMLGIPSGGVLEDTPRFPVATLLAMKELWAYFYAYIHFQRGAVVAAASAGTPDEPASDFHVITGLEANGTLSASSDVLSPFNFSLTRHEAQQRVADGKLDPLFPQFISFVDALVLGGWRVDHVRLPSSGWGIAVHYL